MYYLEQGYVFHNCLTMGTCGPQDRVGLTPLAPIDHTPLTSVQIEGGKVMGSCEFVPPCL